MPLHQPDVLIMGGGVIGLTTALCLADKGLSISLLDRQSTGQEASWAGAGMLPPGNLQNATPWTHRAAFGRLKNAAKSISQCIHDSATARARAAELEFS